MLLIEKEDLICISHCHTVTEDLFHRWRLVGERKVKTKDRYKGREGERKREIERKRERERKREGKRESGKEILKHTLIISVKF